jgi:hypothetical protein
MFRTSHQILLGHPIMKNKQAGDYKTCGRHERCTEVFDRET